MKLVTGHDETILAWLEQKFGVTALQTPRVVLGIVDSDGVLRGCFLITWRGETTAELHLYGRSSNDTFKEMFAAVFLAWGVHRLEVRTARTNSTIKRAAPKFGFKFEGIARSYYGAGRHNDAFVFAMTPDQCRWINGQLVQVAKEAGTAQRRRGRQSGQHAEHAERVSERSL